MTIKAEWMQIWKKENSKMFTNQIQHASDVAFIDGQIKLMKATHVVTWKELVVRQYCACINRYFQMGIKTVVLAFDDYDYVPLCKNMTQMKRKRHIPPVDVHENQSLPAELPHNWQQCIMNRTFKTKVIHLIVEMLPQMIRLTDKQSLIIDYKGPPVMYFADQEEKVLADFPSLGEADIKFTRYMAFGNMLVDATDGDYIPIALMKIEQFLNNNQTTMCPDISIYRMAIKTSSSTKRTADDKPKFSYEYLHVNKLYKHIIDKIFIKLGSSWQSYYRGWEMALLATCITYTGCDFCKGLPQIGPQKIWDNISSIWPSLFDAFDDKHGIFDVEIVRDKVISRLYSLTYKKHFTHHIKLPMQNVIEHLQKRSSLSQSIKDRLPTTKNVDCLIKNGTWVLSYWTCNNQCPNPMHPSFGFCYNKKGIPIWEDDS